MEHFQNILSQRFMYTRKPKKFPTNVNITVNCNVRTEYPRNLHFQNILSQRFLCTRKPEKFPTNVNITVNCNVRTKYPRNLHFSLAFTHSMNEFSSLAEILFQKQQMKMNNKYEEKWVGKGTLTNKEYP